ncbi:hypothetical protein DICPUDRAFT_56943 [Dictyostelium purpureum]|uniref:Sister chromatid cohesion protein n=1 Tax=Dictyostelium purpureum TaxID=5786 RepID=F0ZTP2_DICPU|nr:uncharacterized protein DICPUDRAFT_56943 [Dictyostelium purpureum]EGC32680.1 hypothetical protein DICPUDRAFT_56943 [Dictyostelium purpureum]|eukprot:XP_003290783.1 hypothetical protein DICPUDRAFT_56943 [Dictyostelium purpureum]
MATTTKRGSRSTTIETSKSTNTASRKRKEMEEEEEEDENMHDNQDDSDFESEEIETEFKIKDTKKQKRAPAKPIKPASKANSKATSTPTKPTAKATAKESEKQKQASIVQPTASQSTSSQQAPNKRSVSSAQPQKKKESKIKYNLKPFNTDRLAEYDKHMNDESLTNEKIIKRLKKLDEFLQDKKRTDVEGLELVLNVLVDKKYLENKNFEIKLMTSCCLAEVFRIYSPTIPFEANMVKEVFKLFIFMILSAEQVDKKLFPLYFQMLERLSVLKVFALLVLVDSDMIPKFFKDCISKVSGDQQHQTMDTMMLTILNTTLESLEEVPNQLWNILLESLVEHEKGGVPTPKALFTRDLIEINSHFLKIHFDLYLQDLLDPAANDPSNTISSLVKKKKYEILTTMFKISPPFIFHALPALEFDLEDSSASVRKNVVKVLKNCYTDSSETADVLIQERPTLYTTFLNRFHDVEADIRMLMMDFSEEFKTKSKLEIERVVKIVHERFRDSVALIRIKAIAVFQQYISSNPEFATQDLMSEFLERIKDKEVEVRKQALVSMANLWLSIRRSKGPVEEWPSSFYDSFANIPNTIIQSFTLFDNDKFRAEITFDSVLLPQFTDTKGRSEVFLEIYDSLEESSKQLLKKYFEEKKILRQEFMTFYNLIRNPKPASTPSKQTAQQQAADEYQIEAQMTLLANLLPKFKTDHPKKLLRELMTKKKIFDSLSLSCDINTTPQKRYEIRVEILSKANDESSFSEFLKFLVNKLSYLIIGKENVKYFIRSLRGELNMDNFDKDKKINLLEEFDEKDYEKELKKPKVAMEVLLMLSQIYPDIFDQYGDQLIEFLTCSKSIVYPTLQILLSSTKAIKFNPNSFKSMLELLLKLTEVQQPVLARLAFKTYIKFATPALTSTTNGKVDNNRLVVKLTDLTDKLFEELADSKKNLLSILEVIGCISKCYSGILIGNKTHETELQRLITKQILPGTCTLDFTHKVALTKSENNSNHHSKDVIVKIAAIRCLSNYLLGIREIKDIHHQLVNSMFELYEKVNTNKSYSDVEKGHLKLQIAIGLLKIFQKSAYEKEITPSQFILLCNSTSITLKTRNDHLIKKIIEKLAKYLRLNRLPMKYMCAFGMAAQQPNSVLTMVRKLSNSIIKTRRAVITRLAPQITDIKKLGEFYPESSMPYFLYVVSHREDFARENYIESAIYLNFFMDLLIEESDNYSIIHSTLTSIKKTTDALEPKSKNHIIAAEISLQILAHQHEQKKWKPQKHPVEIILPDKFFKLAENSADEIVEDVASVKLPSLLPKRFKLPPLPKPSTDSSGHQNDDEKSSNPAKGSEETNDEEAEKDIEEPKGRGGKKAAANKPTKPTPASSKKKAAARKKKKQESSEEESEEESEGESEDEIEEDDE